jgi:hypothetical protein
MPLKCGLGFSRSQRITRLEVLTYLDGFCLIVSKVKAQSAHIVSSIKKAGQMACLFFVSAYVHPVVIPNAKRRDLLLPPNSYRPKFPGSCAEELNACLSATRNHKIAKMIGSEPTIPIHAGK